MANNAQETIKTWIIIVCFLASVILGYANLKNEIDNTSNIAKENKAKIDELCKRLETLDEIKINLKNLCDKLDVRYQEK